MKLKRYDSHQKKYYDGRLKYIGTPSKYEFINLFDDREDISFEEVKTQIIKLREEFYELMAEPIYTINFKKELFDLINAGVNLAHCMELYYVSDNQYKHNKYVNNYDIYNLHVNKINNRLLNKNYKWGINLKIEGRNEHTEEII